MKTMRAFCQNLGQLLLRLGLAVALFPHGAQKMLGIWGGTGFSATLSTFTEQMHVPWLLALAAILLEFFAPIALVLGLLTRLAGLAIATHIVTAAFLGGHVANGFFMNWFGNQKGEGFEYHILMATLGLGLALLGSGKWSLDCAILCRRTAAPPKPNAL